MFYLGLFRSLTRAPAGRNNYVIWEHARRHVFEDLIKRSPACPISGLGGYHGSVILAGQRIYYAVAALSEVLSNGRQNGIVAFTQPWKNAVATMYHELNEARTDPDVE